MNTVEEKLALLGIELPESNPPAANYVPYRQVGNLVFIAGQTCRWNGVIHYAGAVGGEYTVEEGQQAARLCGLNVLAQLKQACDGDLEKVKSCVRLTVFINATAEFADHANVANGVSDLMVDVFGEKGQHTRSTVGASSLPSHSSVEVDAIFEVTP